jgi:uncharacterized repeat protein (TIGR02543 family)
MESIEMQFGMAYTLPANTFSYSGYTFTGWKINNEGDTRAVGYTITVSGNITLYAQWSKNTGSDSSGNVNIGDGSVPTTQPDTEPDEDVWPFDDVDDGVWYAEAVNYNYKQSLMKGTDERIFSPGANLTRAMFVTVLGRLAEQKLEEVTSGFDNPFADVPEETWYTQYVAWAATKGIVLGYSPTRFGPNDLVTREQMAALLIRFCDYMGIELGDEIVINFTDADSISDWARESVNRAVAAGLMQGSDNLFRPKATASRAEVAQLFMNFMKAYIEQE